jgi:hypothetical protein
VREGDSLAVLPAPGLLSPDAPSSLGSEVLRGMMPDLEFVRPALRRFLRSKAAPGAEVLWVSESGDPLLALERVGLGATAACPFALPPAWLDRGARTTDHLLLPLIRALASGRRGPGPTARIEGDELVLRNLPADAPGDLEARVFAADGATGDPPRLVLPLSPPIEGVDPRRERRARLAGGVAEALASLWDPRGLGYDTARTPRVEVRTVGGSCAGWPRVDLALAAPRGPEFVLPRPRSPTPRRSRAEPARACPGASRSPHPAAPWVLLSGMLLLAGAGFAGSFGRRAG